MVSYPLEDTSQQDRRSEKNISLTVIKLEYEKPLFRTKFQNYTTHIEPNEFYVIPWGIWENKTTTRHKIPE